MDVSPLPPTASSSRSQLLAHLQAPGGLPLDALDWSTSPLGAPENWSPNLISSASLMLASGFPMFLAWGPELVFLYNDAYAPILGDRHPAAFGRPFHEVWPEIWRDLEPLIERALAGEAVWLEDLPLTMRRKGYAEETFFTFSYSPLRGLSGAVEGMFCACTETTDRVLGERKLRASEARATSVLAGMAEGFILLDRNFRVVEINEEASRIDRRPHEAVVGRSHWELWPGTEDSELGALYRRAMAERVPVDLEHRYIYPDGRAVWFDMRAYPHPEGLALFYRDVTERRNLEEERRGLAAVVEQSRDFIGIADVEGRGVYLNPAGRRLAGLPDGQDVSETRVIDYFAEDDRERVEQEILPAVDESGFWQGELRFRNFSHPGETPVFYTMFPVRDEAGAVTGYATVTRDLTEWKQAEARLRETERRLFAVLDNATVSVFLMDDRQRCVYMNRAAEALTGWTLQEVLARDCPLHDIVHHTRPDGSHFPLHECAIDRAFPENALTTGEEVFVHRDGSFYPVAFTASPIRDEASRTVGTIIEVRAIAAEKAREAALRDSHDRFRAAVQAVRGIMWTNDAQGRMTGEQPGWEAITGQSRTEYEGYGWASAVHPDDARATVEAWNAAVAERRTFLFEHRVRSRDGAWRHYSIRALPILEPDGSIREWVGVHTDITEQREAEAELRESNEELQRYAYIVSHDLRAPLVNVMGFTSELEAMRADLRAALGGHPEAERFDTEMAEALGFIQAATTKMEGLIAAILRLSREGRRTFRPEALDMGELLRGLADAQRHQADAAGARVSVAGGMPVIVADRLAVEQIFGNLLDNALKYLAPGRLGRIELTAEAPVGGRVRFHVRDNGRGIDPRDHGRVFELFRRSGVQDRPGEGIGLAHVKALVRSLGGRIAVSSELGSGTTFTVTLPLRGAASAPATGMAAE